MTMIEIVITDKEITKGKLGTITIEPFGRPMLLLSRDMARKLATYNLNTAEDFLAFAKALTGEFMNENFTLEQFRHALNNLFEEAKPYLSEAFIKAWTEPPPIFAFGARPPKRIG